MSYNYFPKVLEGNKDRNSNVKHVVYGVLTRYLRFLPQTHQGEVCMRTEVFGVKQMPSKFKNYCVMWSLHLLIYEQRFKPCGFVIWIGSFNNTNQSLSAWGKKPSHCDELLMLINSARMHQFLLYISWWIVLLVGPVGFWAEDCKKNSNIPQTFLDDIAQVHGVPHVPSSLLLQWKLVRKVRDPFWAIT